MVNLETRQLQSEICFYRGADVGGSTVVNRPAAVFVLVSQNLIGALLEALLITGPQERMHQNVIGFETAVGFELAAPVAIFVLLREQPFAGSVDGRGYTTRKVVNFPEAKLQRRGRRHCRRRIFHKLVGRNTG